MDELLHRYIDKCDSVLQKGAEDDAKALVNEIISVFASSISKLKTGLDMYAPGVFATIGGHKVQSPPVDYLSDLRKLRGKLEVEVV